jgi:hypothetical protein
LAPGGINCLLTYSKVIVAITRKEISQFEFFFLARRRDVIIKLPPGGVAGGEVGAGHGGGVVEVAVVQVELQLLR